MASSANGASPPKLIYTALEGRALFEAAALPYFLPLLATTPRGDGHPVLLIPGFVATDATMTGMRVFLRSRGYHVENWGFGQNTGFKLKFSQALEQKVRYLHHKYQRKVSVVGWSLGGVYAYYVAHAAPECVRTVISLGSPMRFDAENLTVPMAVKMLYRYFAHPMGPVAHLSNVRAKVLKEPPPVPSTCVYSDTDGVVPRDAARIKEYDGQHENVWVPGSHIGLGMNAAVMWIVADRLGQPEGHWKPFEPRGLIGEAYKRFARIIRGKGIDADAPIA
jgi:pimeloyl-ACP methyl ester carboxylesterase